MSYQLVCGDCLNVLRPFSPDTFDLVFFSPPYEDCRTYGIDFDLEGQAYVDWMVKLFTECRRVCKGLVACVIEGKTRDFRYSATPLLLAADLHRAGFHLRKPPIFHRVGIPGSGGPDWLRNDYEFLICTTRGGKLPWSDNTVMGHPPKWAPGGEMSHRLSDGTRRNQWGSNTTGNTLTESGERRKDGSRKPRGRPSHKIAGRNGSGVRSKLFKATNRAPEEQIYVPPTLANPGNVIADELTLAELSVILADYGQSTSSSTDQILRELRSADSASRLREWFYGVCLHVQAAAFLRPSVRGTEIQKELSAEALSDVQSADPETEGRIDRGICGEEVLLPQMPREGDGDSGRAETRRPTTSRQEDCTKDDAKNQVREVRSDNPAAHTSQGRRRDEQRPGKSSGALSLVSSQGAQEQGMLHSELQSSLLRSGVLRSALPQIQDAWRSASETFSARRSYQGPDLIRCLVGGGLMGGDQYASRNEAPYPEKLCEFFIRSFCPPGGRVLDPTCGSGTTLAVAHRWGRDAYGIDLRESQVQLSRKRLEAETPMMPGMV